MCVCVCVHRVSIKIICNHNENRNTFPSLYQMNSVSCAIVPEWKGVRRGQIFGSFWTPDCTHIEKDYFLIQINVCTYAIFLLIIMISYFVTIVRTWCESRFSVPLVHTHTHIHTDPEQELLFYLTFHVNGNESHLNDILMTFKFISMRCAQYVPANTILCHHTKVSMAYAIFPLLSTLTLPFQIQPAKWNLEWLWCMKYCISTLICYKLCSSFDIL